MAAEARTNLSEAGISVSDEILDTLVKEDAAATKTAVQSFVTAFNKAVDSKVKEALRGKTPSKAGNSTNKGMTKAQIMAVANKIWNLGRLSSLIKIVMAGYKEFAANAGLKTQTWMGWAPCGDRNTIKTGWAGRKGWWRNIWNSRVYGSLLLKDD